MLGQLPLILVSTKVTEGLSSQLSVAVTSVEAGGTLSHEADCRNNQGDTSPGILYYFRSNNFKEVKLSQGLQ